jgi:prevent-host-death family protein
MRSIKASEFKARCLKLMDEVAATGEPIEITENGRPVARLVPPSGHRPSLWRLHEGRLRIIGDVVSPHAEDWQGEQ